jgi:hypothetical protein
MTCQTEEHDKASEGANLQRKKDRRHHDRTNGMLHEFHAGKNAPNCRLNLDLDKLTA